MKILKISERIRQPKDEKGGGLLTLLGMSSIIGVITLSVAGAATFGTIFTHENLANKQAKDSADSGISEAFYKLSNGSCVDSGSDPTLKYTYQVYHSQEATAPTAIDTPGLVEGCPTDLDRWVLIKSEGEGKNETKNSSIATFKWVNNDVKVIPQIITGQQLNLTSVEISGSAAGLKARPTIYSKNGGVICEDFLEKITKNVNLSIDSPTSPVDCSITGDIHASADVDLNSATVNGDACSTGSLINAINVDGTITENASTCGSIGSMYGYKPDFTSNTIDITAEDCANFPKFKQIVETKYSEPTILNASSCATDFTNMMSADARTFDIGTNDLTIIVDEDTTIRNLTVKTSEGPSSLNFVIPSDESNSTQSSCSTSASLNLENVIYEEGANGIFYSPCSTSLTNSDISGQVYGGNSVTLENTKIRYYPIRLPNTGTVIGDGSLQKHLVRVF